MSPYQRLSLAFCLSFTVMAPTAFAQPTSDANRLPKLLNRGDTVLVLDTAGARIQGRVEIVSDSGLELRQMTLIAPSAVQIAPDITRVSFDQIAAMTRTNPSNLSPREELYQRADTFGWLPGRIRSGDVIRIVDAEGAKTDGKVIDISTSSLAVAIRSALRVQGSGPADQVWGETRTFVPSAVRRIERPAHLWDGAAKGAVVALAIVAVTAASTCEYDCSGIGPALFMSASIGAGIGVGIDALFPPRKIYRAPK